MAYNSSVVVIATNDDKEYHDDTEKNCGADNAMMSDSDVERQCRIKPGESIKSFSGTLWLIANDRRLFSLC